MKTVKQGRAPKPPEGSNVRRFYIFDTKIVNMDECIVQGRRSVTQGDCDLVEVHKHAIKDECAGVFLKNEGNRCFRFGKGL